MADSLPTHFLVCLHEPAVQGAAEFIASVLTKSEADGGAELLCRQEKIKDHDGLVLHVTATHSRIYEIATAMEIKVKDDEDVIRPFVASELASFPPVGYVGPLTLADVQKCLLHAMEMIHFDSDQESLPGHPNIKVMSQSPVLPSYSEAGLIDMFPLHDDEELRKLHALWSKRSLKPPITEIRNYFGENVALYVAFTSYYTVFLIPMALFGVLHFCLDYFFRFDFIYNNLLFACINLACVTVFLELWKRQSNVLAFQFGTLGKLRHKKARSAYRGEYRLSPVTGQAEIFYPIKKTMQTMAFISIPVTSVCLVIAFLLMLLSFETEIWMADFIGNTIGVLKYICLIHEPYFL